MLFGEVAAIGGVAHLRVERLEKRAEGIGRQYRLQSEEQIGREALRGVVLDVIQRGSQVALLQLAHAFREVHQRQGVGGLQGLDVLGAQAVKIVHQDADGVVVGLVVHPAGGLYVGIIVGLRGEADAFAGTVDKEFDVERLDEGIARGVFHADGRGFHEGSGQADFLVFLGELDQGVGQNVLAFNGFQIAETQGVADLRTFDGGFYAPVALRREGLAGSDKQQGCRERQEGFCVFFHGWGKMAEAVVVRMICLA